MSLETTPPRPAPRGRGRYPEDRRYSYSELELRSSTSRLVRPQMTSQNGVITISPDSEIPRSVDLRRAKSLRVGRKDSPQKRYSVIFDLPGRSDGDSTNDLSNAIGRHGLKKPQRLNIPEETEDDDLPEETKADSPSVGFNTAALRRNLVGGLEKVLSGKERRTSGAYVQFRDEDGDWRRHSIRRMSQYEPCDFTFKVSEPALWCRGTTGPGLARALVI